MGSLVHSSECGKATAVFEVSFHLDVVAENCIYLWFQALEVVFSCTKYYSIDCCCSQVLFLLLQKHKLARTCTTTSFFQAEDGIRDAQESRGLGDVYKRQALPAN